MGLPVGGAELHLRGILRGRVRRQQVVPLPLGGRILLERRGDGAAAAGCSAAAAAVLRRTVFPALPRAALPPVPGPGGQQGRPPQKPTAKGLSEHHSFSASVCRTSRCDSTPPPTGSPLKWRAQI